MKVLAVDVSSNNHNGMPFNWPDVKKAGYDAVYVKATQNNNYLNPYLIADCRDARNAGLEVGIYHFYGTSNGLTAHPTDQAEWFKTNGLEQVAQYLTLLPVVDVETGIPGTGLQTEIEDFITAIGGPGCGVYMNRSFDEAMPRLDGSFLWLAWPGYTNEALPSHCVIVQTGQQVVNGIGENTEGTTNQKTDIDTIFDIESIKLVEAPQPKPEPKPTPNPIEKVDPEMVSTTELADGTIVTYVLLPSNEHLIELTREKGTVGQPGTNGWSIIDVTDEFPAQAPA